MKISNVEIAHFRALEQVSIPLNQFSVILGENDVGKTSLLYALETFFLQKKLTARAHEYFLRANIEQKRKLLTLIFANLEMQGGNLPYTLRKPFDVLAQYWRKYPKVQIGVPGGIRTPDLQLRRLPL